MTPQTFPKEERSPQTDKKNFFCPVWGGDKKISAVWPWMKPLRQNIGFVDRWKNTFISKIGRFAKGMPAYMSFLSKSSTQTSSHGFRANKNCQTFLFPSLPCLFLSRDLAKLKRRFWPPAPPIESLERAAAKLFRVRKGHLFFLSLSRREPRSLPWEQF